MTIYNVLKLDRELREAGLLIHGCFGNGAIDWAVNPTPEQLATAAAIVAAHDPHDYVADAAETSRQSLAAMLTQAIQQYDAALANWPSLTAAQKDAVVKRNTQVMREWLIFQRTKIEG